MTERVAQIKTVVSSFPRPVVIVMRYLFAFLHQWVLLSLPWRPLSSFQTWLWCAVITCVRSVCSVSPSTVMKTWCSPITWPCALDPVCSEGAMKWPWHLRSMMLSRPLFFIVRASIPGRPNSRARSMRNAWLWSRNIGESYIDTPLTCTFISYSDLFFTFSLVFSVNQSQRRAKEMLNIFPAKRVRK